jgi:hypothetical protein
MTIGIIGAGHIGGTLATLLTEAGHHVVLSNSRGPDTLADQVAALGPEARAATVQEAAAAGDIVIEAIPFGQYRTLPAAALREKVLVSASNYYPERDGRIRVLEGNEARTHTELVADHVADGRVVKAFNTIYWEHLRDQGVPEQAEAERRVIPLAGDDAAAKEAVATLIRALGFAPLDLGDLRRGGRQMQPGQPIYNKSLTLAEAQALLAKAA